MIHRIELFFQHYLENGTFEYDSKNWTFFDLTTIIESWKIQRIDFSNSKNWTSFEQHDAKNFFRYDFFRKKSKNWTPFFSYYATHWIFFSDMTQRSELILQDSKTWELFLHDSKTSTFWTWLNELSFFSTWLTELISFLEHDSQNWTFFFCKNMTHRNWTLLFNMSDRNWLHFSMTQRIFLFYKIFWLKE